MKTNQYRHMALTGLFAAMITIMTAYVGHIPYGSHGGYIHFGDALIYLAAVLLPRPYALAAAAIGGGLADLLTAPAWAPATIIIKMLITIPFTGKHTNILSVRNMLAPIIAAVLSISGYCLAEGILFGSFATALVSVSGNTIQAIGSAVIFFIFSGALNRAGIKTMLGRNA